MKPYGPAPINAWCPECRVGLVTRANPKTLERILACPRCPHTEAIPYDRILRRAGQRELFEVE